MRITTYIWLFLLLGSQAFGQGITAQFEQANKLYQQEKFEEAADSYQEIVNSGYEGANLYYNLGNCYFKMDQLALSILHYRRAELLDPYDDEIRHNLELARKAAIDDFETMPLPLFRAAYLNLLLLFSADNWAKLGIGGLGLLILGTFFYLFTSFRRGGFVIGITGLLSAVLFLSLAIGNQGYQKKNVPAIVMTPSSYAKSGPGEKAEDVFILHEGAEVKIIESFEDWRKIRLPDGKVGWIDAADVEII